MIEDPAAVIVGGQNHGQVFSCHGRSAIELPIYPGVFDENIPTRSTLYYVQRIFADRNIWRIATPSALVPDSMVRQAMTALLGLSAVDRERCFVGRVPEDPYEAIGG